MKKEVYHLYQDKSGTSFVLVKEKGKAWFFCVSDFKASESLAMSFIIITDDSRFLRSLVRMTIPTVEKQPGIGGQIQITGENNSSPNENPFIPPVLQQNRKIMPSLKYVTTISSNPRGNQVIDIPINGNRLLRLEIINEGELELKNLIPTDLA